MQRRIQSFSPINDNSPSATSQPKKEISDNPVGAVIPAAIGREAATERVSPIAVQSRVTADRFLSPIALIPANDQRLGPPASSNRFRCSDKGFLPLSQGDYLDNREIIWIVSPRYSIQVSSVSPRFFFVEPENVASSIESGDTGHAGINLLFDP